MYGSSQTVQVMDWTIETSWFYSRFGQELSLLCAAPGMTASALGSFRGAEGTGRVNLTTVPYLGWRRRV